MDDIRVNNKILNWQERAEDKPIINSLPLVAKIEVTNKCNLRCKMCQRGAGAKDIEELDFALFKKLEPLFPTFLSVYLYGIGEVLTYMQLPQILDYLLKYNINVGLITNGILINDDLVRMWVEKGLYKLSISIDGATQTIYENIRIGAKFEKLLQNIDKINNYKHKYNKKRPLLTFNFVAMRDNINELPALIDLADKFEVEEVIVNDLIVFYDELKEQALNYNDSLCYDNFKLAQAKALDKGIKLYLPAPFRFQESLKMSQDNETRNKDIDSKVAINRCTEPWSGFWMSAKGIISPCCYWLKEMGDLRKSEFLDIWNNQSYQALRKIVNTDRRSKHCLECAISGMQRRK